MSDGTVAAGGDGGRGLVMLLHGLGRTYRSMRVLESAIERAGHRVLNWDYPGRRHGLDELIAMLRQTLGEIVAGDRPVHFVTHSLGGILVRGALRPPLPVTPGRIVMIAPPNHGVRITGGLGRSWLLRRLYGRPILDVAGEAPDLDRLGTPPGEIGIIAGVRRFHPFNPTSYFNAFVQAGTHHDGTVELERTKLAGMADFIVVEAHHTFICTAPEVARQTLEFLERGAFDHGAGPAAFDHGAGSAAGAP